MENDRSAKPTELVRFKLSALVQVRFLSGATTQILDFNSEAECCHDMAEVEVSKSSSPTSVPKG